MADAQIDPANPIENRSNLFSFYGEVRSRKKRNRIVPDPAAPRGPGIESEKLWKWNSLDNDYEDFAAHKSVKAA